MPPDRNRKGRQTGRAHTTVHVRRSLVEKLNEYVADLHLRRDLLLNLSLSDGLREFRKIPAADMGANRADSTLRRNDPSMFRLGVVLDSALARNITKVCREKNISRDAFVERTIELLVGDGPTAWGSPLGEARSILSDPMGWIQNNAGNSPDHLFANLETDRTRPSIALRGSRRKP